ncbi:MAG: alanine racemase [Eubacteriales bacterium]
MDRSFRSTWCEINLDNLIYNYKSIKHLVGRDIEIIPVIKANAYGHGAIMCGKTLLDAGANRFAVAIIEEGIQLRKAGITCSILILGYVPPEAISQLIQWNLTPTVYTEEFAQQLSLQLTQGFPVHIKLDTGMGRLGFKGIEESIAAIKKIHGLKNIVIEGIYSHFAVADERDKSYSQYQISQFQEVVLQLEKSHIHIPLKHMANSAGIIDLPESYYNSVRPGIMLYGLYPSEHIKKVNIDLRPVKTFKTTISNIKMMSKGESVSYGRKYIASDPIKVAVLSVGYADGYSRLLSNKGQVLIQGIKTNIIGTVCMDQCMIDITHHPHAQIGDEVILYGEGLPIEEVAEKIGTINYEVSCMTKERVSTLYFLEEKLIYMDNYLIH